MTAADRPSATDNARAACGCDLSVGPNALHIVDGHPDPSVIDNARDAEPLAWCPGCGDRILTRVVRERGVCSECWGTRDDPWAAARAETTTATTEDDQTGTFEAILAAHRDEYDSDCGMYFGCSCGWDNDDIGSNEGYVEHVAGLLATARTLPTREQIMKVGREHAVSYDAGRIWCSCGALLYDPRHGMVVPGQIPAGVPADEAAYGLHFADAVLALLGGDNRG